MAGCGGTVGPDLGCIATAIQISEIALRRQIPRSREFQVTGDLASPYHYLLERPRHRYHRYRHRLRKQALQTQCIQ